jgi:hypothetical protein
MPRKGELQNQPNAKSVTRVVASTHFGAVWLHLGGKDYNSAAGANPSPHSIVAASCRMTEPKAGLDSSPLPTDS